MARNEDVRTSSKSGAQSDRLSISIVWWGLRVTAVASLLLGSLYAWHRIERFLINDPRFAMAMPDYGLESPSLEISGLQHASRAQVLRVFAPDYGRSLYLLPLDKRRAQLIAIEWVQDASISRLWPNRVMVSIQERVPVAFLHVPVAGGASRFALIDGDGLILQPPAHARFNLPVALGINPSAVPEDRRSRVRRLMTLVKDVGPLSDRLSEVDVTDMDNLKVTARVDNRAILLMLGDHNFAKRLQNFINHYPKIQERLANATMLDMRLEDRITVVEGGPQP